MHTKIDDQGYVCQACGLPTQPDIREIIDELFDARSAEQWKNDLWLFLELSMSSEEVGEFPAHRRAELLFVYKTLVQLIDDLFLIQLTASPSEAAA